MKSKMVSYILILPFILLAFFYLYENRLKLKGSIVNWHIFYISPKSDFPLRVSCSNSEEDQTTQSDRVFLDPLQFDQDDHFIFWMKSDSKNMQCTVNQTAVILETCVLGKKSFHCLKKDKYIIYLWNAEEEYTFLLTHHSTLPRKVDLFR
jgi:hypothetical protein